MDVWVVTLGEYADAYVAGVFSDEATARRYAEPYLSYVERFVLDAEEPQP